MALLLSSECFAKTSHCHQIFAVPVMSDGVVGIKCDGPLESLLGFLPISNR